MPEVEVWGRRVDEVEDSGELSKPEVETGFEDDIEGGGNVELTIDLEDVVKLSVPLLGCRNVGIL